ncbi:protein jag [Aceticella autotrophica]|uniref:RNA-binding protein KhpB n=1 Tax=Aceticella autotrophica TaxID=2755338 RepID=A0A975AVS7_9THEO|nr:RNA-binding cell elongation regulator Jag/EloR [Aceticella autotrophica]QSZ27365.1 protein jag [Aceticella autotrophica]
MREIIKMGKTVNEAVEAVLNELNVSRDMIDIEVLEKGSAGFFGLLGKNAIVKVIVRDAAKENASKFLKGIINLIGIDVKFEITENDNNILINLSGKDVGVLIGYRGETLDSLQYLIGLVVNRSNPDEIHKRVFVDAENYRKKREEILIKLARRLAKKVKEQKKSITLEPMNPNERRIIHLALQDDIEIETYSDGEEPNRRVIIALK